MTNPALSQIPDDLLRRSGSHRLDTGRSTRLIKWLNSHGLTATLLELENERTRRATGGHE